MEIHKPMYSFSIGSVGPTSQSLIPFGQNGPYFTQAQNTLTHYGRGNFFIFYLSYAAPNDPRSFAAALPLEWDQQQCRSCPRTTPTACRRHHRNVAIIGMVISHRQTTVASGVARNLQQRMEMVPETTSFHA